MTPIATTVLVLCPSMQQMHDLFKSLRTKPHLHKSWNFLTRCCIESKCCNHYIMFFSETARYKDLLDGRRVDHIVVRHGLEHHIMLYLETLLKPGGTITNVYNFETTMISYMHYVLPPENLNNYNTIILNDIT